jgi:hypothetical protein
MEQRRLLDIKNTSNSYKGAIKMICPQKLLGQIEILMKNSFAIFLEAFYSKVNWISLSIIR